jgi:glutaminyl-peptide cyclotransferase
VRALGAISASVLLGAVGGGCGDGDSASGEPAFAAGDLRRAARAFDAERAMRDLRRQVRIGPRHSGSPGGSREVRWIERRLRTAGLTGTRTQRPWRNVVARIGGERPGVVVVGAHHDTKDGIPGFVGANDGASGTAAVVELARSIKPRQLRPTVVFVLFDGEESPKGTPDNEFERYGLRGSKVAAAAYRKAEAMILLDFVGDTDLSTPREANSNRALWAKLRAAAKRTGNARHFPPVASGAVVDDHIPFLRAGVPSIDLIDFDFACWHRTCDDLSAVSAKSLDATGETVLELLRSL